MRDKTEVIITAAIYFCYFLAGLLALILLAWFPKEDDTLLYAYLVVFVTSGLHFGFTAYGFWRAYTQGKDHDPYPVDPMWLFLLADVLMALAVIATIGACALDYYNRMIVTMGIITVMSTQSVCALKTHTLLTENRIDGEDDGELMPEGAQPTQRATHV